MKKKLITQILEASNYINNKNRFGFADNINLIIDEWKRKYEISQRINKINKLINEIRK